MRSMNEKYITCIHFQIFSECIFNEALLKIQVPAVRRIPSTNRIICTKIETNLFSMVWMESVQQTAHSVNTYVPMIPWFTILQSNFRI